MIQITEFRIGNYLLVKGVVQQLGAIGIAGDDEGTGPIIGYFMEGVLHYEHASSERVQAVPLTDDLLQQCGFSFHNYFHYWQKLSEVLGTGVDMELDRDHTVVDFSHRPILKEIKYLHHLQNLYFALKRKELSLGLPVSKTQEKAAGPALETLVETTESPL
jgi:hypothetical protein